MSLKFLQQMAEKYNLVYVKDQTSIYLEFEPNRSNSNYQVAKWYDYGRGYILFPVCIIRSDNKIATCNDQNTWVRVKTNVEFEKELIKFVANYKKTMLKQKIQTIEKDFV